MYVVKPELYKFRLFCCTLLHYTVFITIRTEIYNLFPECHNPE